MKNEKIIEKQKELIGLILSGDVLILPKEAFEEKPDGESVGLKILAISQKVTKLKSELAAIESEPEDQSSPVTKERIIKILKKRISNLKIDDDIDLLYSDISDEILINIKGDGESLIEYPKFNAK